MASSPLIVEARLSPSNLCSRLRTAFGVSRQQGWLVGATKPTGRPCRQRTLRCSQGSQGWKLKLVRQGPERWQWTGRELSRPKSLDIRRPIQGRPGPAPARGACCEATAGGGRKPAVETQPGLLEAL